MPTRSVWIWLGLAGLAGISLFLIGECGARRNHGSPEDEPAPLETHSDSPNADAVASETDRVDLEWPRENALRITVMMPNDARAGRCRLQRRAPNSEAAWQDEATLLHGVWETDSPTQAMEWRAIAPGLESEVLSLPAMARGRFRLLLQWVPDDRLAIVRGRVWSSASVLPKLRARLARIPTPAPVTLDATQREDLDWPTPLLWLRGPVQPLNEQGQVEFALDPLDTAAAWWRLEFWRADAWPEGAQELDPFEAYPVHHSQAFRLQAGSRVELPPVQVDDLPILILHIATEALPAASVLELRWRLFIEDPESSVQWNEPQLEAAVPIDGPLVLPLAPDLHGRRAQFSVESERLHAETKWFTIEYGRQDLGRLEFATPASLRGTVVDAASGAAVGGLRLQLEARQPQRPDRPSMRPRRSPWRTDTDPSGRFRFDAVSPGNYLLIPVTSGPRASDRAEDIALELMPAQTHEVVLELGRARQALALQLDSATTDTAQTRDWSAWRSDGRREAHHQASGNSARLSIRDRSALSLTAWPSDRDSARPFTVATGSWSPTAPRESVSLTVVDTHFEVAARDAEGHPLAGAEEAVVEITRLDAGEGFPTRSWTQLHAHRRGYPLRLALPADGSPRRFMGLAPGRYRLEIRESGGKRIRSDELLLP